MNDTPKPIAYLVRSHHVICLECIADYDRQRVENGTARVTVPVYRENIGAYAQGCHDCGKLIVAPRSVYGPTLFTPEDCPMCTFSGRKARDYREYLAQVAKA